MASISAISAFSGTFSQVDTTHPDTYKLYPAIATNVTHATSARVVLGTNYAFGTSGYNSYQVQMCDYQPNLANSNVHAKILAYPAYFAGVMTLDGATINHCKLFTSTAASKYKYTGTTEETEYGSFGPIICRYGRFVHISGNMAYDYQRNYSSHESISLITKFNIHDMLPTSFDDSIYESSLNQMHIAWLSSYEESGLEEGTARHIVYNPASVGWRIGTANEFHSPIRIQIYKPANSYDIEIRHDSYIIQWTQRRIGRFLIDVEFLL